LDSLGCEKVFPAVIGSPPELTVSIGEDQQILLGDRIRLEAVSNRPVNYEWTTTDSLDCTNCSSVNAQPLGNVVFSVKVVDISTGCEAEDSVNIVVIRDRKVFFPSAFSPNGDGVNDEWSFFAGSDVDQIITFRIFSRSGTLVYQADQVNTPDLSIYWDGTFNGKLMDSGVFVYLTEILFADGEQLSFQGDFTLLR